MNAQPERSQPNASTDNVVQLHDYFKVVEGELDPETLSQAEVHDFILSRLTHPTVSGNAFTLARAILKLFEDDPEDDWKQRARGLAVDASELDDASFERVRTDAVAADTLKLIRSKSGHAKNNEDILAAARKMIDLRAGVILGHEKLVDYDIERWQSVITALGKVSLRT